MNDDNLNPKKIEGIDDEFQDIALKLKEVDFSQHSNKKKVYSRLMKNIEKSDIMRKLSIMKKVSMAAAIVIVSGVVISQNTSAKEAIEAFVNKVSLGSITVYQESEEGKDPDDYKTLYDESGKEVDMETIEKGGVFYSKNGEEIKIQAKDEKPNVDLLVVDDANKINDYTCFDVKLPLYLPEGYEFEKAEFYKDKNESEFKDNKYCDLTFVNSETGKEFNMQERKDCEETKYEMSTDDKVERIQINGVDAALTGDRDIDWVNDGTIYGIMGKHLSRDEVIKVAESIE